MDDPQRLCGRPGQGVGLGLQPSQNASAALGGLDEQNAPALAIVRQQLAGQLGVLQLERGLDAALEGVLGGDGRRSSTGSVPAQDAMFRRSST